MSINILRYSMRMNRKSFVILFVLVVLCLYPSTATADDSEIRNNKDAGLRVQLKPVRYTTLSSELAARIEKMDLLTGDSFSKGDVLVAFDCRVERAKLEKARARLEVLKKEAEVNTRLAELESISIIEVEKSLAKIREAEADIAVMEATVDKCVIFAPFSGRVSSLNARKHQFVSAGQNLLDIIDDRTLEVELLVPSEWLMWLKPGLKFYVQIDETSKKYTAKVSRTGASIDPVSQTVEVMGTVSDTKHELLPGMSGYAFFHSKKSEK